MKTKSHIAHRKSSIAKLVLRYAILDISFAILLAGCSKYYYNPAPQILPQYIKKMAVRPFANHTKQYGIEDKLTLAVQSEFNRDGRYQITTEEQSDGFVIGDITKYILEPLSYDSNHVPTEYKLTILVTISFTDKIKSSTLWTEPNMSGELRYFVASSGFAGSLTEDDARQTIFDQLSRDIATRTFEGFGGATNATDKTTGKPNVEPIIPAKRINPNPPAQPSPEPPAAPMRQSY